MKILLSLLTIVGAVKGLAQHSECFYIYFSDDKGESTPIENARVSVNGTRLIYHTNQQGKVCLDYSLENGDTLIVNHTGFEPLVVDLTHNVLSEIKSENKIFFLESRRLDPFEFNIAKIDTIFGSEQYYVSDYMFGAGFMLLLVYEQTLEKGASLLITDFRQEIKAKYVVPAQARKLFMAYDNKMYVICDNRVFEIEIERLAEPALESSSEQSNFYIPSQKEVKINLIPTSPDDFYAFTYRILAGVEEDLYYSNYSELYPGVSFFVTSVTDTSHIKITSIQDDFMMELYRAQYKYLSGRDKLWAYRQEQKTGIDKEIIAGANVFTKDILYKPIYAPLFAFRDTIYVMDHYKNQLRSYYNRSQIGSVNIDYHLIKGKQKWKEPVIKDQVTGQFYLVFNSGGYTYLRSFDKHSGKMGNSYKLGFRFVENIKIRNGQIFYIYRPYESLQKKFLYKENILIRQ